MNIRRFLLAVGVLTLCYLFQLAPVFAHTPRDANFLQPEISKEWLTLRTPHFNIHYEATNRMAAGQMAKVAEQVHERLTGWLEWEPKESTEVVILDSVDFSNGMATPIPFNRFQIYMPAPVEGRLLDHNPWLDMVFTHEYVHILQLDMVSGAPKRVRDIFGRLSNLFSIFVFPQLFAPSWVTEGLAVYGESDNAEGYGRLNSAWYESAMRLEVERGLRSLTEISFEGYSGGDWPYGQIYLYGAFFMQFIEEQYGREKLNQYFQTYSDNLIPWRMDNRSKEVLGQTPQKTWHEFSRYLKKRFKPQLNEIKAKGENLTQDLVNDPYESSLLTATDSGNLYFYHNDALSEPTVRRLRHDGIGQILFSALRVRHMDWHDQSGLLLNREAVCDNVKLYTDLYLWHPGEDEPTRLTECGRYRFAVWRPNGEAIAALQLDQDKSRLLLLDAKGASPKVLSELPSGDVIGHLSWAPDGLSIVAAVKRELSGWNIELFDLEFGQWRFLTRNSDIESRPEFSVDGQHINFLSDRNGVWNLRQLQLGSGEVVTLSNTASAVTEAVQMPDRTFRMVEYRADGMAITTLDDPSSIGVAYPAQSEPAFQVRSIAADAEPVAMTEADYDPLETLKPRSWFPLFFMNNSDTSYIGVAIHGRDVLGFHHWSAMPLHYIDQRELGGQATYSFDDRITLSMQRQFLQHSRSASREYIEDEWRVQLLFNHWINSLDNSLYAAAGVAVERSDWELVSGSGQDLDAEDTLAGVILGYDDTEYYRQSVSLVDGRQLRLSLETYDLLGQSDHSGETILFDWKEYLRMNEGQVLKLRMIVAWGDKAIEPYELGGEIETLSELGGITELGRRLFPLRGFASGHNELSGNNVGFISAEWRYPLGRYYDGWFVPPVGLGRHSLSLFIDSGDAWGSDDSFKPHTGIGAEWSGEVLLGYNMIHLGVTFGLAHGLGDLGDDRLYLKVGLPM